MTGIYILVAVIDDIFTPRKSWPSLVWVEEEEIVTLNSNKVVRGGWATAAAFSKSAQACRKGLPEAAYPAMPTEWGSCKDVFRASQYTGVMRSIPSRMPTRIRVGVNPPSSAVARERNRSS